MRRLVVIGIGVVALAGILVGYRGYHCAEHQTEVRKKTTGFGDTAGEWTPSEAELTKDNKGVGWVFGRMMGVADAPGSLNHSPFVGSMPAQPQQQTGRYPVP